MSTSLEALEVRLEDHARRLDMLEGSRDEMSKCMAEVRTSLAVTQAKTSFIWGLVGSILGGCVVAFVTKVLMNGIVK